MKCMFPVAEKYLKSGKKAKKEFTTLRACSLKPEARSALPDIYNDLFQMIILFNYHDQIFRL